MRFATKEEAERYVADLAGRWLAVRETRVVESDDPVTHEIRGNTLRSLDDKEKHGDVR